MIKELFGESSNVSMMRAMMFIVVLNVMGVWTALCVKNGEFMDMPPEGIALIGTMVAGKTAQKFGENKKEKE